MPLFLDCNCEGCGKKFKLTDDYMLCLKDDKLVELKFSPLSLYEIKCHISQTYCSNCRKFIKIYIPHYMGEEDKDKCIEEIKEYLSHKRPRKYINVFMEDMPSDKIVCPGCKKEVKLGYMDMDKCPECGSEKFEAIISEILY